MKFGKILIYILFMSTLLLPLLSYTNAAETPNYVGISENQTITWKTTFDQGPWEDYLVDRYYISDDAAEDLADDTFEHEFDEDVEGWKIVITEIKDEKEYDMDDEYPDIDEDEHDGVPFIYSLYTTENWEAKDWEDEDKNERTEIFQYDTDLYTHIAMEYWSGLLNFDRDYLVVSKNTNWKKLVNSVDDELEDDWEDAGASRPSETVAFFWEQDLNGIEIYYDLGEEPTISDDVEDFETLAIYDDNGILKYYEWSYDGDPMVILELEEPLYVTYWWVIAIVAAVAIIVIIIVLVKRR